VSLVLVALLFRKLPRESTLDLAIKLPERSTSCQGLAEARTPADPGLVAAGFVFTSRFSRDFWSPAAGRWRLGPRFWAVWPAAWRSGRFLARAGRSWRLLLGAWGLLLAAGCLIRCPRCQVKPQVSAAAAARGSGCRPQVLVAGSWIYPLTHWFGSRPQTSWFKILAAGCLILHPDDWVCTPQTSSRVLTRT